MLKNHNFNNKYVILGILLIIFSLNCVYSLKVDNPQYQVDKISPNEVYPQIIHPGDNVDVWFKITNDNDNPVKNIKITISPYYPFEIKQVSTIKGTYEISHLNTGESDNAYFKLYVNDNTKSGSYKLKVQVSGTEYHTDNGETIERPINFTKIYYIPIYSVANFEINCKNSTISPSTTENIRLYVDNKGNGNSKNVIVNLIGTNKLNIVGPTTYYLGTIQSKSNTFINTKIYALSGSENNIYPIIAHIRWTGEDGLLYNTTIPINFKITKLPEDYLVFYNNISLIPGETKEINLSIKNNGVKNEKNVIINIIGTNNVNVVGPIKYYIGDINSKSIKNLPIKLYVLPNSEDKIYPLNISIQWETNEGEVKTTYTTLNLKVIDNLKNRKPMLYIDSYKYSDDGSEIIVGVANRGDSQIKHCVLILNGAKEINNNYIKYIGDLEGDDYSTESYLINAKPNENIPLKLKLKYFDNYNNEYVIEQNFTIKLTEQPKNNFYFSLIIGIILLIIIIVGYKVYKKRNKKNKNNIK